MQPLSLGYSPCPNDTFIFHALVQGLVRCEQSFQERLEDVETLNRLVLAGELDLSKISYGLLGHVRERYCLLRSGGALGCGCGPLLVARRHCELAELKGKRIAIPGIHTTAYLLLQLREPELGTYVPMPFHQIIPAVVSGQVDAGLIIHESRFTYQSAGLQMILDLGAWWEEDTGQPIPLGGIVARRSLGASIITALDRGIRASLEYARSHPEASASYIRSHAQELDEQVCAAHINLYVNDYSLDLGEAGERAVTTLLTRAERLQLLPASSRPLFFD